MCRRKYKITLSREERAFLRELQGNPHRSKVTRKRAILLIALDESVEHGGLKDQQAAELVGLSCKSVERLRKLFVEEGFEAALHGRARDHARVPRKLDGADEARLVQLACSQPPPGHSSWSLRLLTSRFIELGFCESIGRETVRRTLKKTK